MFRLQYKAKKKRFSGEDMFMDTQKETEKFSDITENNEFHLVVVEENTDAILSLMKGRNIIIFVNDVHTVQEGGQEDNNVDYVQIEKIVFIVRKENIDLDDENQLEDHHVHYPSCKRNVYTVREKNAHHDCVN